MREKKEEEKKIEKGERRKVKGKREEKARQEVNVKIE